MILCRPALPRHDVVVIIRWADEESEHVCMSSESC